MDPATAPHMFLQSLLSPFFPWLYWNSILWTAIGFAGNILFGSRFVFQWIASEKKHSVVVPAYFWQLSFWGSVLNLFYSLHLDNPPLIFGVMVLPFIYGRNLFLLRQSRLPEKAPLAAELQTA